MEQGLIALIDETRALSPWTVSMAGEAFKCNIAGFLSLEPSGREGGVNNELFH